MLPFLTGAFGAKLTFFSTYKCQIVHTAPYVGVCLLCIGTFLRCVGIQTPGILVQTISFLPIGHSFAHCHTISKGLIFLGKHSYNIFLFHTFINRWILFKFLYSFASSPLWALPLSLTLSILSSMAIDWLYHRAEGLLKHLVVRIRLS